MKYTPTTDKFHDTIHLVDQTTPVQGGAPVFDAQGNPIKGASNASRVQLADNIAYLKKGLETATTVVDGETTSTLDTYVKETRSDVGALEVRADDLDANKSVKFANYTALGNYTGKATAADITSAGIAGRFYRRGTAADNGGTVIKDGNSNSWERDYSGIVNARWFGVSTSQSSGNSDALVKALAVYDEIFIPEGEYTFDATVQLPNKDITLFGGGTLTSTASLANGILCQQNRGVKTTINSLKFSGASPGFYRNANDVVIGTPANDEHYEVEITGCTFKMNSNVYGIRMFGARESTINYCYFETGSGIDNVTGINVQVIGCTWKDCGVGISESNNCQGLRVIGGTSLGCSVWLIANHTDGTYLGEVMADFNDVTITGYNITNFHISNSYLSSRTKNAALAIGADSDRVSSNIRILGTTILNNFVSMNPTYTGKDCNALYFSRCSLLTLQNCMLMNYTSAGLITVTCDHVYVFGNSFNGAPGYKPNYNILDPLSDTTFMKIHNNNFSGNVKLGQLSVATSDVFGNDGVTSENGGAATIAASTTSVVVSHGMFRGPQAAGVVVLPTTSPPGYLWVSDITDTSFKVNVSSAPSGDFGFQWKTQVLSL